MTVTPETARWEAFAAARTRGDVGEGIASVLALLGLPDLISFAGGFPDPETFPRERVSSLLQEFAETGELSAFQYAPTRGLAGPLDAFADRLETLPGPSARRRRADDHERRDRGARAGRQVVPRPRRRRRRRGADLSRRDPGVPKLRGEARRGPDRRARARGGRAGTAAGLPGCARSSSTRSPTTRTRRASASRDGAARAAGRARAPLRLPDRRGRRLPRARLHRRDAAEPLEPRARTSSSRPARPRRRSSRACGSAGPSALPRSPRSSSPPSRTPTSARARSDSGSSRSRARRGWIDEQLARSRALYRRKGERLLAALERSMPRTAPAGPARRAASSPG